MSKYICIDTNIPLLDVNNILTLGQNATIIIPETVIDELDSKKSGLNELAFQARSFGRLIANCDAPTRVLHDNMVISKFVVAEVNVWIVSLNSYPSYKDVAHNIINDRKIIEVALQFEQYYQPVTFISNDIMARIRADSLGLTVSDFKIVDKVDYEFTKKMEVTEDVFKTLHNSSILEVDPAHLTEHYNYIFSTPDSSQVKIASINNEVINILGRETEAELRRQEVNPRGVDQLLLARAIQDPTMDLVVCEALAGSGKAQPLSEPVLTATGWKTMGELKPGMQVVGSNGLKNILAVHPQGVRKIYTVTFIDGTQVNCDIDHLWTVTPRGKKSTTITVREMLSTWVSKKSYDKRYDTYQNTYNYTIEPVGPCEFGIDTDYPIDPYALGLLLGDGSFGTSSVSFTNSSKEICDRLKSLLEPAFTINKMVFDKNCWNMYISKGTSQTPFKSVLKTLGLDTLKSTKKFVPPMYLTGSLSTREAVYQGLTDTDGYVKNGKVVEYSTSSSQLAVDYLELARSIGKVFTINSRVPKYTYRGESLTGATNYRLREMKKKPKSIINIEYSHTEEAQCISIDSVDNLYVTTGYNLTHNTLCSLSNAMRLVKTKSPYNSILYIRASINDVEAIEEVGFLKGSAEEKNSVYFHPLYDSLNHMATAKFSGGKLKGKELTAKIEEQVDKYIEDYSIECLTGLGLRGRTFTDALVIIDEVQGQSKSSLQKMLTRFGKNCKVILIGSNNQIDNPNMTKYTNGLSVILNDCATVIGDTINKHVIPLHKVVRSDFAEYAERLFSKES